MHDARVIARVQRKYRALAVGMDERIRRQWAAVEARDLGYGGVSAVARATGLSRTTITSGLQEPRQAPGRKSHTDMDVADLASDTSLEPETGIATKVAGSENE